MKTITKIFGTALLAAAAVALSSCTEEVEYTPADPVDGPQVYFSPDSPSTVELSSVESSFDVTILRATQDEAVSFTLEVSDPSGLFTIPTAVSFASGQTTATLTIGYSYNEDDFPFDTYYDITIAIPDGYNTPYGLNEYDFAAGVPGPWTSLGMCTFNDYFFFEDTYQVEIFQNDLNPNQFRLEYPYAEGLVAEEYVDDGDQYDGDQYLVLTVLQPGDVVPNGVTITESDLVNYDTYNPGWYYSSYDSYVVLYYPYYFSGYETEDMWEHNRVLSYQDPDADGNVLPAQIQLAPFFYLPDYGGGWNYSQYDEVVVITFPGVVIADYSVDVAYAGKYTDAKDDNYIVGAVTLGEDVESADVALLDGSVSVDDIDEAVAALGSAIEVKSVTASGNVSFVCNEGGTYTLLAVTYGNGDAQEYAYKSFTFSLTADPWTSLGYCLYTEDFMTTFWSVDNVTYEVEIQESSDTPGLFRLVNPYCEAYPYNDPGDWDDSQNWYIEINCEDPDGVYIDLQDTGCDWGYGDIYVYSMAANYLDAGYPLSVIKAAGYCGTYADGVITFPTKQLLIYMPGYSSSIYYANTNGAFKVVMPSARTSSVHQTSAAGSAMSSRTLVANPEQISGNKVMRMTDLKPEYISTLK